MAQPKIKRRPKNGDYFVACIVGATPAFLRQAQENVAKLGVFAKYLWGPSPGLERRDIPEDIDVLVVLRDSHTSREVRDRLMFRGRQAGVWTLDPPSVHSDISTTLAGAGFERPMALDLEAIQAPPPTPPELAIVPPPAETPTPDIAPVPTELMPPTRDDKAALVQAGNLLRRKRNEQGKTLDQIGKAINTSGSNIGAIEVGRATPSDALCEALEKYYGLPEATIPRLAKRKNNARVAKAMRVTAGPPVEASPDIKPVQLAPVVTLTPVPPPVTHTPYEGLMLRLAKLQAELGALGVARIEITQATLTVTKKES